MQSKPKLSEKSDPVHIISLGAGVQSSTMALMAACGELTPMPACAVFADTQDEPKSVYVWLDWLEKQLPFPVHRVTFGKLSEKATLFKTSRDGNRYTEVGLPVFLLRPRGTGIGQRQCTQNHKILPIRKFMRQFKKQGVVQWIGISFDELHRMKPSRDIWCENIWPLVDARIRRHQCLSWMQEHGFPEPPRSACSYCPYHSDAEWRRLKLEEPEAFDAAVKFEAELQEAYRQITNNPRQTIPFLHNSRTPLAEVDFSNDTDNGQQVMFGNDCTGMCGV